IALFTHRIPHLTDHLKSNKKDKATQRALMTLVGKRRRLLDYLKKTEISRYRAIVQKLNLRK
ncbi:MAG: 30S ribosomal protein S15, partial [Bacteroidales bacterium]|nr:30S ribosomal protein S15 [Bacteroidales bacterium]